MLTCGDATSGRTCECSREYVRKNVINIRLNNRANVKKKKKKKKEKRKRSRPVMITKYIVAR